MAQRLWELRKAASDDDEPAFTAPGGYVDANNLFRRMLKPAARAPGVPWAGFHTLRHTCATLLFRNGLNAKQAQVWLGHHSPAFTLATYVHLLTDDLPEPEFFDFALPAPTSSIVGKDGGGAETLVDPPSGARARLDQPRPRLRAASAG